jgi:hypothetical protein
VLLDHVAAAARQHAGRPALMGILPTLTRADLGPGMMTDAPRYRALNSGLRRLRPDAFRIRIAGNDPLELASEDVGPEGANSSFQIHLRVDPDPLPGGAGGQAPALDELRLHQGTVWRWNRAIYDPAQGGHLRIEMRALPAGPTVIDMLANAAFLIGLSVWLAGQDERWTYALPFERADHNFYRAAQHGLSAQLTWPTGQRDRTRTVAAARLVAEVVPAARQGLVEGGRSRGRGRRSARGDLCPGGHRPDRRHVAARHPRSRRAASRPRARTCRHARPLPQVFRNRAARPHLAHRELTLDGRELAGPPLSRLY